jgi:tryptophan synthase alpha chain
VAGAVVPDLPPEEGAEYLQAMRAQQLASVLLFAPNSSEARMQQLAAQSSGFVYCVARKGVTGQKTDFSEDLTAYLARARRACSLPLAVGFGIKDRADVDFMRGKADIAVVGSECLRVLNQSGVRAAADFIRSLTGAPPQAV